MNQPSIRIEPWNDNCSVGNALLDQQHKRLHQLCNEALAYMEKGLPTNSEAFHKLLNDVATCSAEHFTAEEKFLASRNYPFIAEHKMQHEAYQDQLSELLYETTIGTAKIADLALLLKGWWELHAMDEDKKFQALIDGSAQ